MKGVEAMTVDVLCYDAFTNQAGMGNPAGICFDANHLTESQMQEIAGKIGYSETAFVVDPSEPGADYRFRYFTPSHEVDLCGHATVATIVALAKRFRLTKNRTFTIETRAGLLKVIYDVAKNEVVMEQSTAKFETFAGNKADLFAKMELSEDVYDSRYPIVYGSTGVWTVVIPVKNLADFCKMVPHNDEFKDILTEHPNASLHPFCTETIHEDCTLHARHFSASGAGSVEDPVTGTANGVLGAYYITYIHPKQKKIELLIEQGQDMGRDGFCRTFALRNKNGEIQVRISGTATFLKVHTVEVDG